MWPASAFILFPVVPVPSLPACEIVLSEVPPAERGVGGQHHDEGQQPVEHAEDGGAALARGLLGPGGSALRRPLLWPSPG